MIDREYLKLDDNAADAWQDAAEREFNFWASDPRYCDAASTTNFYGHHDMALRSTFENGDIFYLLPMIERMGSPYKVKMQALEADRVCNKDNTQDALRILLRSQETWPGQEILEPMIEVIRSKIDE